MNGLVESAADAFLFPAQPLPPPRLTIAAHASLSDFAGGLGDGVGGA